MSLQLKSEVVKLLDNNRYDDAIILCTEQFMNADTKLRVAVNNHETRAVISECLAKSVEIENVYTPLLNIVGNSETAFEVSCTILFISARLDFYFKLADKLVFTAYNAFIAFQNIVENFSQDDEYVKQHVQKIMGYLASLIYAFYNIVKNSIKNPDIRSVYDCLKELIVMDIIQTPRIDTPSGLTDPIRNPLSVMQDLVGRAIALDIMHQ